MKVRRRGRGVLAFALALLAVVVVGGLTGVIPFRQIMAGDRAIELSQQKLEALVEENRRLEQHIVALQTPEEVERLARENFGLVMPGEIGYVARPSPGSDTGGLPWLDDDEEDRPWWRSIWDFLTGRDLVGDD